ncbi:MAG: hypothetical protein KJ063_25045 [Anaerolineae bacterium]|nr:hypothetical protein [Anaerolineae bacterium]
MKLPIQLYFSSRLGKIVGVACLILCLGILLLGCNSTDHQPSFANVPAILVDSSCVATVCVGDLGRRNVIEKLSYNVLLANIRDNGGAPVWFTIEAGGSGGIYFAQDQFGAYDIVDNIRLDVVGMPLGTLLNTLGNPDELFLMFGCGRGSYVHGKLFYREEGIEIQVQFPVEMNERTKPVVLTDRSPMGWVWYFAPVEYDEWLLGIHEDLRVRNGYFVFAPTVTAEMLAAAVQPWPGLDTPIQTLDLCPR